MIEHRRDHAFVPRDKSMKRPPCALCGLAKGNLVHHGTPKSLNVFGSGAQMAYQGQKKAWANVFWDLLRVTDLPKPCDRIVVEGEMCFPDRIERDQGNYRFMVEKALGDVLQQGGWLEKDSWDHYEFGNLTSTYERGVSWTRLILMPLPRIDKHFVGEQTALLPA